MCVLQKDFLKYTVRSEAADFAVSMLMGSNHTLLQVDCPNDNSKMYNINWVIFNGTIFLYIADSNSNQRVVCHLTRH